MSSIEQNSKSNSPHTGGWRSTSSASVVVPSIQAIDTDTECNSDTSGLNHRSVSLSTLQPNIIEPRMAQLETLEAKMASIEVSLSSTPRRKKNGSISGISLASSIRSIPKELAVKELESLRNALRDKENIIQSLKGQLIVPGLRLNAIRNCNNSNNSNLRELSDVEKKQAEDRLCRLKTDIDNKRLTIKNLKMALERLDITDNIDVRIQQAELEYQLGREELNLLTLLEESRTLQICIEESNKITSESHTLYSCVQGNENILLQAIEVEYDSKSPKFGAAQRDSMPGLYIDWALEETHLRKDDRLIEVNGKIVLNKNRDDLTRLLSAAPDPAQIVVLRRVPQNGEIILTNHPSNELIALRTELEETKEKAEEVQKLKESLKSDNIRLTHRISYLEEQVSELLNRKPELDHHKMSSPNPLVSTVKQNQNVTNINIISRSPVESSNYESQIFQKGPQINALVSHGVDPKDGLLYQMRSKSSLSNVSNTHISSSNSDIHCQRSRHKHRSLRSGVQVPSGNPNNDKVSYRKHHHHHHREKDYSSETNSGAEQVKRYNQKNIEQYRYSGDISNNKGISEKMYANNNNNNEKIHNNTDKNRNNDLMDQSFKKATKIVRELTSRNRDTSTTYEKHKQKCITASEKYDVELLKHYNARKSTSVLDFRSEIQIGPKYDTKSADELEEKDSRLNDRGTRKIQDARSVKSLDFDSEFDFNHYNSRFNGRNTYDYSSECQTEYGSNPKSKPAPPKKPLRLSLQKTHSMHSMENGTDSSYKNERKSMKRNYKGETPLDMNYRDQQLKWNYRKSIDSCLENGSWC